MSQRDRMAFSGIDNGRYAFSGLLKDDMELAAGYSELEQRVQKCKDNGADIPLWGYIFSGHRQRPPHLQKKVGSRESKMERMYIVVFKGSDYETAKKYFLDIADNFLERIEYMPQEKIGPRS